MRKLGLNVGSGQRPFHSTKEVEWVNIDSQAKWNPDLLCDGAHLPYEDNTVDYFVLHHVLEHFGCGEGLGLIKEAHRVLKLGGSLLIFVPDMFVLAHRWLRGELETQIYMTNVYGAYMGDEADRHKWGFDRLSLFAFIGCVFPRCYISSWDDELSGADIAKDWWIIGVEAIK